MIKSKPRKTRTRDEEAFLKKVGQKITKLAAQKKISLEQLAYESGVSKGYFYDLAKGKGNPSMLLLYRIAESNAISITKLIDGL